MNKALVVLAILAQGALAEVIGLEALVVLPRFEDHRGIAFQGSIFTAMPKLHGALENGIFLKPGTGSDAVGHAETAFGYQMGYTFIPNFPLLRPGFFAGICYDKWITSSGPTWMIHPNYGVKVQVSILSASFSGRGFGFGVNYGL